MKKTIKKLDLSVTTVRVLKQEDLTDAQLRNVNGAGRDPTGSCGCGSRPPVVC